MEGKDRKGGALKEVYGLKVTGQVSPAKSGRNWPTLPKPPSKSSNGQPNQGLLQTNFDLKAVTTSSFDLDCPQPYPKVSK